MLNTSIGRGSIDEKGFPTDHGDRVAEIKPAEHIPCYGLRLCDISVFAVEVLSLEKWESNWYLVCNAEFVFKALFAFNPYEMRILGTNGEEDGEFVER